MNNHLSESWIDERLEVSFIGRDRELFGDSDYVKVNGCDEVD